MGSTVLNFFAVTYLPLTLTSTILFSAPIIICFLSWPLQGERVGIYRWSAIMLGFFGWSGHQLLTKAHNLAPASMLTPFGYSFILFLTIWSYAVFDHLPDKWTVMGALIIVVSGVVIWFRELLKSRYKDVQTTGL